MTGENAPYRAGARERYEAQRKDEADGFYDAWRGWAPDPDRLGNNPDDYHRGYEEQR